MLNSHGRRRFLRSRAPLRSWWSSPRALSASVPRWARAGCSPPKCWSWLQGGYAQHRLRPALRLPAQPHRGQGHDPQDPQACYPDSNIAPIDYDPSATKVNQENRIKLMLAVAKERLNNPVQEPVKPLTAEELAGGAPRLSHETANV